MLEILVRRKSLAAGGGPGQQEWITPGTYSWVVPVGVTSISAVAVGAAGGGGRNASPGYGAGGGGGGALAYINGLIVTPGSTLTVVVGKGGRAYGLANWNANAGEDGTASTISKTGTALLIAAAGLGGSYGGFDKGYGGAGGTMAASLGTAKYPGGDGGNSDGGGTSPGPGGGGAAGYGGAGGRGYYYIFGGGSSAYAGIGGSGAGGGQNQRGGGVGIRGLGASGTAASIDGSMVNGSPGPFGGGGTWGNAGANGAVRIIWGAGRAYPSTGVASV